MNKRNDSFTTSFEAVLTLIDEMEIVEQMALDEDAMSVASKVDFLKGVIINAFEAQYVGGEEYRAG